MNSAWIRNQQHLLGTNRPCVGRHFPKSEIAFARYRDRRSTAQVCETCRIWTPGGLCHDKRGI